MYWYTGPPKFIEIDKCTCYCNRVIIVVIFYVLVLSSPQLEDVYGAEYLTDETLYCPSSLVRI